jgi:hypothetical protein
MGGKGAAMTDDAIRLTLTFDPEVTRAALAQPLSKGKKRPQWQKLVLAVLGGGVFGAAAIVILRLGFGLNDALAYLMSAVVGASLIYLYWRFVAQRGMAQIIDKLAALDAQEGATEASFSAAGVTLVSANAQSHLGWAVIASIDPVPGGTALLFGASRLAVPDACLPPGLDGESFRTRLHRWNAAHD